MPYTPPADPSPSSSAPALPNVSRRSSPQTGARPSLPRAASYLLRHRRSPLDSVLRDASVGTLEPQGTSGDLESTGLVGPTTTPTNMRQSLPQVTDDRPLPKDDIISPPDSTSSGIDDEGEPKIRGRKQDQLKDLRDAISHIPQRRATSPSPDRNNNDANEGHGQNIRFSSSTSGLGGLVKAGRKIAHARSITEPQVVVTKPANSASSEDDTDKALRNKPQIVHKKSGELVRPALRSPSRRRPSSMPGSPTFPKTVHFDSSLEHVRHFLQFDRPQAVSAGSSPVKNYDSDADYPFPSTRPVERASSGEIDSHNLGAEDKITWESLSRISQSVCLLLSRSKSEAIPAFLFWRPWQVQTRWSTGGKLEHHHDNPSQSLGILHAPFFTPEGGTYSFPSSSVAWYYEPDSSQPVPASKPVYIAPDAEELFRNKIVTESYQDGLLYLKLSETWKDEIERQTTFAVLVLATCDLAMLAMKSLPDPYSEPLWEFLSSHSAELFRTTVLPVLFTAGEYENSIADFRAITSSVSELGSLVLHSVLWGNNSFEMLLRLGAASNVPTEITKLMVSRTSVLEYVASEDQDRWHGMEDLIKPAMEDDYTSILFAFLLSLTLRSALPSGFKRTLCTVLELVMERCGGSLQRTPSIAMQVARCASGGSLDGVASQLGARLLATIGTGLAGCRQFEKAAATLQDAVPRLTENVRSPFNSVESTYLASELIKCLTLVGDGAKAESAGVSELESLKSEQDYQSRADIFSLVLATADSMIGQARYTEAKRMLEEWPMSSDHYMMTIAALRMSKICRRRGETTILALQDNSHLARAASKSLQALPLIARIEVMTELLATIAHLELIDQLDTSKEIPLVTQALEAVGIDSAIMDDWRTQRLREYSSQDKVQIQSPILPKGPLRPALHIPGPQMFKKSVRFSSSVEHVPFLQRLDSPPIINVGSSSIETNDTEPDHSLDDDKASAIPSPPYEWEMIIVNFPLERPPRPNQHVSLERVWLSANQKSLHGSIAVVGFAPQGRVTCRFTFESGKTVSEVAAQHATEVGEEEISQRLDRFTFDLELPDLVNLESKSVHFSIRYSVDGREYWDDNDGANFHVRLRQRMLRKSNRYSSIEPASRQRQALPRPSSSLPRARRSNHSSSNMPRPKSMPVTFDEFGDESKSIFGVPIHEYLGESASGPTGLRFKTKSGSNLASDNLTSGFGRPSGLAFANRYDFGASLSAAVRAAKDSRSTDKGGLHMGSIVRSAKSTSPSSINDTAFSGSSDKVPGTGSPTPGIPSSSYEELVDKYCFFGTKQSSPQLKGGTIHGASSTDRSMGVISPHPHPHRVDPHPQAAKPASSTVERPLSPTPNTGVPSIMRSPSPVEAA